MARRVKKCWIVELKTPRGWEPCWESEVNSAKEWADNNRKGLQAKYGDNCEYRIAQYQAVDAKPSESTHAR